MNMNYLIQFSSDVARQVNEHVKLAARIWREARADFRNTSLRITAGNVAGYGRYSAICHTSGVIEFPIGNRFSLLTLDGTQLQFKGDPRNMLGTLLHEIGHHVVNTATVRPWESLPNAGQSTHLRTEWLWICHTGWSYFHDRVPTVQELAWAVAEDRKDVKQALKGFSPYREPPAVSIPERYCPACGQPIQGRRSKVFCSNACKQASHRQRITANRVDL